MKDLSRAELEALEAEASWLDQQAKEEGLREDVKNEILSSLTIDDLLVPCTHCHQGEVPNPAWKFTYADDFDWENFDFQALQRRVGFEFLPCPECEGTGKSLTSAGKAISALFHHLKRNCEP